LDGFFELFVLFFEEIKGFFQFFALLFFLSQLPCIGADFFLFVGFRTDVMVFPFGWGVSFNTSTDKL
jgi:hypothetical protein